MAEQDERAVRRAARIAAMPTTCGHCGRRDLVPAFAEGRDTWWCGWCRREWSVES